MSDRLTPNWTENSGGAFGDSGIIGDKGELTVYKLLCEMYGPDNVRLNQSDETKQKQGKDIEVFRDGMWKGIDVKTNFHPQYGNVLVDAIKIWQSQAVVWFHLNPKDSSSFVLYPVQRMRAYIKKNNIQSQPTSQGPCYRIPVSAARSL